MTLKVQGGAYLSAAVARASHRLAASLASAGHILVIKIRDRGRGLQSALPGRLRETHHDQAMVLVIPTQSREVLRASRSVDATE